MSTNELINSIDEQTLANIMSKRHKLARAAFKNPPQPKFCIKERTSDGQECFINVLSYSRIANKLSEFDPIPLYGGMQIRSFASLKNPLQLQQNPNQVPPATQLIFAVMASPEVLKKSTRNQMDNPEQLSLVELMCEFVEAMNPGVVLSKKPEVLRDRDIAGELKDVWSAVQNFRDRERAAISDIVVYTEFGPGAETAAAEPISPNTTTNEPDNKFDMTVDECDASQIVTTTTTILSTNESTEHNVEQMNSDNSTQLQVQQPLSPTKTNNNSSATHPHVDVEPAPTATPPTSDVQRIEIEKLTISPSESKKSSSTKNHHHKDESSEKIVKIQNQKNKESFLPKLFSTSNKDKDKDKDKDKEKMKDEPEVKTKKKSLIFFRRSKSTTSSPTHAPANNATADKNEDDN